MSSKMGNNHSTTWSSTFENIKKTHDDAYKAIEEAISLEERERPNDAIEKYKEGILLIDKALDIQVSCPENPDLSWERACVMIQKMKKSRAEVLMRISCIHNEPSFVAPAPPPSYDEAVASSSSIPRTYNDLAAALNDLPHKSSEGSAEVLYSYDDVRLYFISPDGTVSQTSEPETLKICLIEGEENTAPTAFLQVGEWIYTLVPSVSPCYRTDYGAFILPNVHSPIPGSCVGIILPVDADASVYELLENILHGIVSQTPSLKPQVPKEKGVSGAISNGIVTGAYYLSKGLVFGAGKLGELINYGTPKIINSIKPAREARPIPSKVTKGFRIAKTATSTAANVTGFVAEKVGDATQALGKYLAPHIQKQGTRLLTSGFHLSEEEASSKVSGILTVAAGAVEGFSTVYRGLETSATILGNNLTNNTVKIVKHKYGSPASEIAGDTLNTVGNVISISHNSKILTAKGLAKRTAKDAGQAMLNGYQAETSLYPSLQATNFDHPTTSNAAVANNHQNNKSTPSLTSDVSLLSTDSSYSDLSADSLPQKKE